MSHSVVAIDGEEHHVLSDPSGYVEQPVALSLGAVVLVQHLDGTRTVGEVVGAARETYGIDTTEAVVNELVAGLDAAGLLESPGFEARRRDANAAYRSEGLRPARFAGESYPADPAELARTLDACFASVTGGAGPGGPPPAPLGIVAPHVDLRVGSDTYARAYAPFARGAPPPDVAVVFGTCHALTLSPFVVSSIGYDTPLGPVPADRSVIDAVAGGAGWDVFTDEALHRAEHSVEFQALHLRYLFGEATPPMVAILTGTPDEAAPAFVERVREAATAGGRRACFIAGADLAHVGPRFEDPKPLDEAACTSLEARDRETLAAVVDGNAAAFERAVNEDGNARRICGLSPIAAVMCCTGERPASLEAYNQWVEGGSVVSFAALTIGA